MHRELKELAREQGASAVGISGVDRLVGNPSMDAGYLLPGARSIISIMLPLDGGIIRDYLGKKDRLGFQHHETQVYRKLFRIGESLVRRLRTRGHRALVAEPNLDYRYKDDPAYKRVPYRVRQAVADAFARDSSPPVRALKRWILPWLYETSFRSIDWNLTPSFSHRYGAVAAGIGVPGWSGNVLHPAHGARVLYNTVITDCALAPDPMMDRSPCDGCRFCVRVCQSSFIHAKRESEVTVGGRTFVHNRKAHNLRCIFVCAGFSGQNRYPSWSTWSPGRVPLPETDTGIEEFWRRFVFKNFWKRNYYSRVLTDLTAHSELGFIRKTGERFASTCGNCQLVCWKTRQLRQENHDILVQGGVVDPVE